MGCENCQYVKIQCLGGCVPDQVVTFSQNQWEPKAEGREVTAEGGILCRAVGQGVPRPALESAQLPH